MRAGHMPALTIEQDLESKARNKHLPIVYTKHVYILGNKQNIKAMRESLYLLRKLGQATNVRYPLGRQSKIL